MFTEEIPVSLTRLFEVKKEDPKRASFRNSLRASFRRSISVEPAFETKRKPGESRVSPKRIVEEEMVKKLGDEINELKEELERVQEDCELNDKEIQQLRTPKGVNYTLEIEGLLGDASVKPEENMLEGLKQENKQLLKENKELKKENKELKYKCEQIKSQLVGVSQKCDQQTETISDLTQKITVLN